MKSKLKMRENRESQLSGKKKAPVSRGCVEVGFFVVGMTDAEEKRNGCTRLENFSFFAGRWFSRLSGAWTAAAADVLGRDLWRVGGEDDGRQCGEQHGPPEVSGPGGGQEPDP